MHGWDLKHLQTYCRLFLGAPFRYALAFGRVEVIHFQQLSGTAESRALTRVFAQEVYSNSENALAIDGQPGCGGGNGCTPTSLLKQLIGVHVQGASFPIHLPPNSHMFAKEG